MRLTDPVSYDHVFALARRHQLTFYDAAYLDAAMREQLAAGRRKKVKARAAQLIGEEKTLEE